MTAVEVLASCGVITAIIAYAVHVPALGAAGLAAGLLANLIVVGWARKAIRPSP